MNKHCYICATIERQGQHYNPFEFWARFPNEDYSSGVMNTTQCTTDCLVLELQRQGLTYDKIPTIEHQLTEE